MRALGESETELHNNGICAYSGTWDICLATVSSESWFRFLRPEKENG